MKPDNNQVLKMAYPFPSDLNMVKYYICTQNLDKTLNVKYLLYQYIIVLFHSQYYKFEVASNMDKYAD